MDPPIPVDWRPLDLAVKTDDSVEVRTIGERLRELWPSLRADGLPFVVWLFDPRDDGLENFVFVKPPPQREATLVMKRFRCLKVRVPDLPESEVKKQYAAALGFRFFDPAGRPVGKPLVKKRRFSRSTLMARLSKTWAASYETPMKRWLKPMLAHYGQYDLLSARQAAVDAKLRRLEMKPNPELNKKVEAEAAELREEWKQFRAEEKKMLAHCRLLPEFRPKPLAPPKELTPR